MTANRTYSKCVVLVQPKTSSDGARTVGLRLLFSSDPSTRDTDYQLTSRHATGGTPYTELGFDASKSRVLEPSPTSPSSDASAVPHRSQHFVSTTNLNINESSSRRQSLQRANDQNSAFNHSTPYLPRIGLDDSPTLRARSRQQQQQITDRYSTAGSDSGIVVVSSNPRHSTSEENQSMEKKLTELVQQLGRQIESDSLKLNERLEEKLKNLENMINQQTFIIQKQDNVIEQLKDKILHLETERDDFRAQVQLQKQEPTTVVTITQPERISDARGNESPNIRKSFSSRSFSRTFDLRIRWQTAHTQQHLHRTKGFDQFFGHHRTEQEFQQKGSCGFHREGKTASVRFLLCSTDVRSTPRSSGNTEQQPAKLSRWFIDEK